MRPGNDILGRDRRHGFGDADKILRVLQGGEIRSGGIGDHPSRCASARRYEQGLGVDGEEQGI